MLVLLSRLEVAKAEQVNEWTLRPMKQCATEFGSSGLHRNIMHSVTSWRNCHFCVRAAAWRDQPNEHSLSLKYRSGRVILADALTMLKASRFLKLCLNRWHLRRSVESCGYVPGQIPWRGMLALLLRKDDTQKGF